MSERFSENETVVELGDYLGMCKELAQNADIQHLDEDTLKNEVLNKVSDNAQVKLPPDYIKKEADAMLKDIERKMRFQGQNLYELIEQEYESIHEFKVQLEEQAENRLKKEKVLKQIAHLEGLEVTTKELEGQIEGIAQNTDMTYEAAREKLEMQGAIEQLEEKLLLDKALAHLTDRVKND